MFWLSYGPMMYPGLHIMQSLYWCPPLSHTGSAAGTQTLVRRKLTRWEALCSLRRSHRGKTAEASCFRTNQEAARILWFSTPRKLPVAWLHTALGPCPRFLTQQVCGWLLDDHKATWWVPTSVDHSATVHNSDPISKAKLNSS